MEKLKAGIYCRVSTTKDAQEESIEQQQINGLKACEEKGFEVYDFYREKKTATEVERRGEYQRMIADLIFGNIDVIVTKSSNRLNRSNKDWYILIDTVYKYDKQIYFYLEKQFFSEERELEYGVRSLIDSNYSVNLSKVINASHKERQESGRKAIFTNKVWGYKTIINPDGSKTLIIDEEEAEMIRLIFQYYIQGYGCHRISKILFEKGYKNHNGNKLGDSVIAAIIRNPKVTGTVVMNKRHWDFRKKAWFHIDKSEWITKEGVVPVIIDNDTWQKANQLMDSRKLPVNEKKNTVRVGRYEGKNLLSKKLYCGLCGSKYYVNSRKTANEKVYDWICSTARIHNRKTVNEFKEANCNQENPTGEGCDNIRLKESDLVEILDNVAKEYFDIEKSDNIIEKALGILREVFIEGDGKTQILKDKDKFERKLAILENNEMQATKKLLNDVISDEMYKKVSSEIKKEKSEIMEHLKRLSSKVEEVNDIERRLKEIEMALKKGMLAQATSYSVLEWSEKLLVYPDRLDIHLDMEKLFGSTLNDSIEGQNKVISVSLEPYKMRYCESGMKKTNDAIIKVISENPKATYKEISSEIGLSVTTVYSRLKDMKEKGILVSSGNGRAKIWRVEREKIVS